MSLKYSYRVEQNISINTEGFFKDISDLDFQIVEKRADFVHTITKYPNGVVLEIKQSAEGFEINSSHKLIVGPNGDIIFEGVDY